MKRVRGYKNKIDVYDTKENKIVLKDTGFPEAAKYLGMSYNAIINGFYRSSLILGRYRINKTGFIPSKTFLREIEEMNKKEKDTQKGISDIEFEERWEDAVRPFRILSKRKGRR